MAEYAVLMEKEGRVHILEIVDEMAKHKGLGVLNTATLLANIGVGEEVLVGQKYLTRMPPRLPELISGMARRAQTISSKDAGFFISRLGIGAGDTVLEAGLGSGGLSLHLAKVLGDSGHLVTAEPRTEHADVGLLNLNRAQECFTEFPQHTHIEGMLEDVVPDMNFDAIILDMPVHSPAILASAPKLVFGGRIACYAPTTSQLEKCWRSCEEAGLEVEWAGELMERQWGITSKGGMRPVNGPFGHTAFLLFAQKK
jgi:tRNA (adenine57-N1/adenine58-N1)-methyltransferase